MSVVLSRFPSRLQRQGCAVEDVGGRAGGNDGYQQSAVAVELDERCGALFIGVETDGNGFGMIVFALVQAAATMIADSLLLWWLRGDVKNRFAFFASASPAQASNDFGRRQNVIHHRVELQLFSLHQLAE